MKILPCPFCGGKAVVDKYPVRGYEPAISFEVRCSVCNQTRAGGYFDTVYKSERWARKKAIEAWNNRPSPWHTETPTEEGWYLLKCSYLECSDYIYETKYFQFESELSENVIEWQKIEEE